MKKEEGKIMIDKKTLDEIALFFGARQLGVPLYQIIISVGKWLKSHKYDQSVKSRQNVKPK